MTILAARDPQRTVYYVRFADGSTNWVHVHLLTHVAAEDLRRAPLFREWKG